MGNNHSIKQAVLDKKRANLEKGKTSKLSWWQLSLIGIGSIIGAGFFLGTGLSIQIAGPAILLNYIIGGITAFFVFSALAEMTVADPEPGSFRTYAKKAFGNSMGFVSGWMYWLSGVFIISSEAVALGTFAKFWFPNVPLWIFTVFFVIIAFTINLLGVKNFGKIESIFAIIKLSTLVIFILFGILLIAQIITPETNSVKGLNSIHPFLATGMKGMWSALIFVFFSFGGIEIIGIASSELKNREEIPKAGIGMLIALVAVYISSIFFVLMMVPWSKINASKSPFVSALSVFHFPYIDSFINLIIISAALSTMVGSLFSVTNIMVSLAEDGEAPRRIANRDKRGTALKALFLTGFAVAISLILSFILPGKIYEYITTAAGVMMILNWTTILSSQIKLRKERNHNDHFKMFGYPFTSYLGILLILVGVSGGLVHATQRMGVFISLGLILIIFLSYFFIFKNRKKSYQN
ncbi:amino acid permease [Bacillus sp. AFS077874]|uniref:amino acid permease n=1 Tax=unclassified Bacillus (in: firmicutes) TaxID=185979 RepID=UPI000BEE7E0F|nr:MULTISPECIES: amino acid permease [unclassified Bacillus (in: firmicutes)]PEC47718.1 amino acid permease [Bacillus sp. AFS096315]PFM83030.1 amino acid permease [Bacillus sp. AFS077874]